MKSKEYREFLNSISELNNAVTHYDFVWNQFLVDYEELMKQQPSILTVDHFKLNPKAPRHRIKIGELHDEHNKTHDALLKGVYLMIWAYFEGYLKNIHRFAQKVDPDVKELNQQSDGGEQDGSLLDKVLNRIGLGGNSVGDEIVDTLDYLRLKRNRLVHRNSEDISRSFRSWVRDNGGRINSYWQSKLSAGLIGVDFANKDAVDNITFNLLIDVIIIFREIVSVCDHAIIQTLGIDSIADTVIIPEFKQHLGSRISNYSQDALLRKFDGYCASEYGIRSSRQIRDAFIGSLA